MKNQPEKIRTSGFTLIEMLVVISIIALLAGMVTATGFSVVSKGRIKRTQTELGQLRSAIESYKARRGFYPPDNPLNLRTNALYYELVGTTNNSSLNPATVTYWTLDQRDFITSATLKTYCGVSGLANSSAGAASDDVAGAEAFLKGVGPKQAMKANGGIKLFSSPVAGPDLNDFNPWYYNSSHPTNNPESYDLWTVIHAGGRTNIICNWSEKPIVR